MSKKDNIASQALLEMDGIVSAIKEESNSTLKGLLAEAVKDALRESCCEDDEEEKDYEVVDDEKEEKTENDTEKSEEENDSDVTENEEETVAPEEPEQAQEVPAEQPAPEEEPANVDGENEWEDFKQYQVGDNTYDLTGEEDYENVVKVYKLLKPEDNVVVKKDGDTIQIQDNENDTEYVIDLGGEEEEAEAPASPEESEEAPSNEVNEEKSEIAGFSDDEEEKEDDKIFESKKTRKAMRENKEKQEVLFEVDLGYTDNYQDKDVISGLSNEEPSNHGETLDKGIPTGTEKPWAGPSEKEGDPFEKKVDECGMPTAVPAELAEEEVPAMDGAEMPVEEGATTVSTQPARKATKQHAPNERANYLPEKSKKISTAEKGYEAELNESKEMKELKDTIAALRKNLNEAYITNVNLGKITKLFLENATSRAEKVNIVNRFADEAKTVEQSKKLYESIDKELKSKNAKAVSINESSVTAKGTKALNEEKAYKSDDLLKTIDLMNRMNNL